MTDSGSSGSSGERGRSSPGRRASTRASSKSKAKPRAAMPAGREAVRAARPARPPVTLADPSVGRGIVLTSIGGTIVLGVTAVAAAISPTGLEVPALVVALAMFVGGTLIFMWAYFVAIARSRDDDVTLLGVYGLSESTPPAVKWRLFGSLGAQVTIAVVTAGFRLYSTLSFGVLATMWGLGLAGLWGAKHGAFPPRVAAPPRRRRGKA